MSTRRVTTFKITILGDGSVGKTSLRKAYLVEGFDRDYHMALGADFAVQRIQLISGEPATILFWDLAGQPRFSAVRESYYRGSHGSLLVFDISDKPSFENILSWVDEILNNNIQQIMSLVLVGNKSDLRTKVKNTISKEQAQKLAEKLSSILGIQVPYIETSAKTGENVENAFTQLLERAIVLNLEIAGTFSLDEKTKQRRKQKERLQRRREEINLMSRVQLINSLEHEEEEMKLIILERLGILLDSEAMKTVINALKNDSQIIREKAVEVLGKAKDKKAVEPLIEALHDDIYLVDPSMIAKALEEIGDSKAIEPLKELIQERILCIRKQKIVIEALRKLKYPLTTIIGYREKKAPQFIQIEPNLDLSTRGFDEIDLTALDMKPDVISLDLSHNNLKTSDLFPLKNCKKLRKIILEDCGSLNLSLLEHCEELRYIKTNATTSIPKCPKLEVLHLWQRRVSEFLNIDLSPLENCMNLRTLILEGFMLRKLDLTALKKCPKLEELSFPALFFDGTELDLSPLKNCKELKELRLPDKLSKGVSIDLTPLKNCINLQHLWKIDSNAVLKWNDKEYDSSTLPEILKRYEEEHR